MTPPTMTPEIELPDSVQAMLDEGPSAPGHPDREATRKKVHDLTAIIVARRDRYIKGRMLSGIEDIWRKCEDNYAGIDAATGVDASVVRPRFTKSLTLDGPLTRTSTAQQASMKSSAFERMTGRYVDAATSKIAEIILSPNAKSFTLDETPDPTLVSLADDLKQVVMNGVPLERDPKVEELAPPNPTDPLIPPKVDTAQPLSAMPGRPLLGKDLAEEEVSKAHQAAKKAENIIYDWMVEGKFRRHMRQVLHSGAKMGVGILKGPFPDARKDRAITKSADGKTYALEIRQSVKPGYKCVSPWDFFPDPDCGADIQSGQGVFERDYLSEHQLQALKARPGYFKDEIDQVILEGPGKKEMATQRNESLLHDTRYEIWYHTGWLTRDEADAINEYMALPADQAGLKLPTNAAEIAVVVTMVNDSIITCTINGLEKTGHYPYRVLRWTPREGCWDGIGVAEQIFMPQDLVNAATRAMINNAAVSSGSQIIMVDGAVRPAGKSDDYEIRGDKLWLLNSNHAIDDVRKVFNAIQIPNITPQMLSIIMHAYQVAENSCNIPLISQGQSGRTTPDTLGATQLQNNNANQLLRGVASSADMDVIEPLIEDQYEWLMLDPDIDNEAKGDFRVSAKGSTTLVERVIHDQFLIQQGAIVKDPAFGINPKKWYAEVLKSQYINPEDISYTKEEQEKLAQQPPPPPPQVEAAKIRAQVDLERIKADTDRDTTYVQAETSRTQVEHEIRMQELQQKLQLAQLEYANRHQISLEQLKTELATTSMKLQVQKQLSAQNMATDLHKHATPQATTPPTEPAGKARTGQAFEQ